MIRARALLFLVAVALSAPAFAVLTVTPVTQTVNLDDMVFIGMTSDPAPIGWQFDASAGTVLPIGCSMNVASCSARFEPPVDTLPGGQQKLRAGTYTIRVTAYGISTFGQQTVTIIVRDATVSILPFNPTVVDWEVRRIEALIQGIGAHQLSWSVNGGGILFNQNLTYTDFRAVDPGVWTITIRSNHPLIPISASAQITTPPVTLNLTPENPTLFKDANYTFQAQLANTARPAVLWNVTNGTFVSNPSGPVAVTVRAGPEIGPGTITATFSPHNLVDATTFQVVPMPKVTVTPAAITVIPASTTRFLATVVGIADSRVTWSTNQPGGSVDATGLFQASAPTGTFQVRATSVGNPAVFGVSTVTVTNTLPPPVSVTVNPATAVLKPGETQTFVFFAQGQNNTPHANQFATWSVQAPSGTPSTSAVGGVFTAPDYGGRYVITARSDADPIQSAIAMVDVTKSVEITPPSATLAPGASVDFSGTAMGFGNNAVTWSLEETGSAAGTIVNGRYTAGDPGIVHVVASAVADPTVRASATVRIDGDAAPRVEITPPAAQTEIGGVLQFTAVVAGIANQNVTWTASAGSIQQNGSFTGPNRYGAVEIRARSNADPEVYGTATVLVAPPGAQELEYDDNGNLVFDGLRRFFWDGENRLVRIEQGWPGKVADRGSRVFTFAYDSEDRVRSIRETLDKVLVKEQTLLWLGPTLVEERSASGAAVVRRFFGEGFQEDGVNYYVVKDHLGNIRDVTDAQGNVRARYEYDAWGRRTFIEAPPSDKSEAPRDRSSAKGFNGFYHHDGMDLDLALYRIYSADLGRWLTADPTGLRGGMNVYAFAANDPINLTDPLGLAPCIPKKPSRKIPSKGCPSVVCLPHDPEPPPKERRPGEPPPLPPIDFGNPWDPPVYPIDPCITNRGGCFTAPLTPQQIWDRDERNRQGPRETGDILRRLDRMFRLWDMFTGLFGAFSPSYPGLGGYRADVKPPSQYVPPPSSSGHR